MLLKLNLYVFNISVAFRCIGMLHSGTGVWRVLVMRKEKVKNHVWMALLREKVKKGAVLLSELSVDANEGKFYI